MPRPKKNATETPAETKAAPVYNNPFTEVEIKPITIEGELMPSRVAVRVADDNGKFSVQGIVGKDYQLLPNRKVRDIADDIMSRCPESYGGFANIKTLFDGKRYVDYFVSNNPVEFAANGGEPAPITIRNGQEIALKLGLMIWNAYDGSRKTGFEIFALNPFCTNQYHSRNRFGYFAWRHTPGAGVDMEDALLSISRGVENIARIAPRIGALNKRPLALPEIVSAKAATKMPQSRWGDIIDALKGEPETLYGLYQAMTNVASHRLTGMSAIDIGSSITDYFLADETAAPMSHTSAQGVIENAERDG